MPADRLPGSSHSNPIRYRGYEIALASYSPAREFDWEYAHEDYDGDEDNRIGRAASVGACKAEIDERIDEGFDDPASVDTRPKDGDALAAPLESGAVGEAETPKVQRP